MSPSHRPCFGYAKIPGYTDVGFLPENSRKSASKEELRVKALRILLVAANTVATVALLAIPVGKLLGVVAQAVDAAAVFGWVIFFVPLLASALALSGIQFSRPAHTRSFVLVAMPGSFVVAFLGLYTVWQGPPEFARIGLTTTILLTGNVVALWLPFKDQLQA